MSEKAMPLAWSELIQALRLLAKGSVNDINPLHCEHDELFVLGDPKSFTETDIAQLKEWGFDLDDANECFFSFRYGSA